MKPHPLGFQRVKVIALSVTDLDRANEFYSQTLSLPLAYLGDQHAGYHLDQVILMLKVGWYAPPTAMPNPRITLEVDHAPDTETALLERGVTIADPVELTDDQCLVGSFLDSEGNKLWFCSEV
ncbi:MAG: VOC family protein [Verrucomicrobiota bacterium]